MPSSLKIARHLALLVALGVAAAEGSAQAPAAPLNVKVYNADAASFHVNAIVVSGKTEAMVIDTGFTRADALRVAANVLDSGKTLKTVFISNADPDFYFGAETLKLVFPHAQVLATPAVRDKIQSKLATKMTVWGPRMGVNAPHQPIVPQAFDGSTLTVDGETIEIRGSSGELAHRPYLWIPSIKAIVGNIAVFNNLHVWTADTQSANERQAWLVQLDEMQALKPALVVPGHMAAGSAMDDSAIAYTRDYLKRFEAELPKAQNSAALIATLQKAYPNAGLGIALNIGAKVSKGEMKW